MQIFVTNLDYQILLTFYQNKHYDKYNFCMFRIKTLISNSFKVIIKKKI